MAAPAGIRDLQREGLDAYRVLFDALHAEERLDPKQRELADALPPPHVALPLRVLAQTARAARLEEFARHPIDERGQPASAPLRGWLSVHQELLERLVPEPSGWDVPPWTPPPGEAPTDAGRLEWPQLIGTAAEVAGTTGSPGPRELMFVLLRDWAFDLEPLLEELDLDLDQLLDAVAPEIQPVAP